MINLILLFPILACILISIFKKGYLNTWALNIYALILTIVSVSASLGKDLIPFWQTCSFFEINNHNIVFLLLLSVVFLAVAIYNNGYLTGETVSPRK